MRDVTFAPATYFSGPSNMAEYFERLDDADYNPTLDFGPVDPAEFDEYWEEEFQGPPAPAPVVEFVDDDIPF